MFCTGELSSMLNAKVSLTEELESLKSEVGNVMHACHSEVVSVGGARHTLCRAYLDAQGILHCGLRPGDF